MFGNQLALTAGVLTYSSLSSGGFKMLPFQASKVPGYSKIFAAFLGFYVVGHIYVSNQFGDRALHKYLFMNKSAIIKGEKSWERED